MKSAKVLVLALLFLFSGVLPLTNVEAADEERRDTDTNYLSEAWRSGLGTSIGSLNSIKSRDIDNDGEDELIFGNAQGFIHILDWDSENQGWKDDFHSVDMGGSVKGMEIAQIDDDPQLEIAIGYNWVSDIGKVKIIDGLTLADETNWSTGISWSHPGSSTAGWPYGLAMGDLDGDDRTEIAMGDDTGILWVVETETPEKYVMRDITRDEAEWYVDVGVEVGIGNVEDLWGVTFGQFDTDDAMEVAVGSKQGWVAIFDGETEEIQWKYDMDNDINEFSLCYSLIAADLDGDSIDELVVPQQERMSIFVDGGGDGGDNQEPEASSIIHKNDIKSGYGMENVDLFGNDNEELVVADGNGNIKILGLVGSNLNTYQEWNSGYSMSAGAGITVSTNGHNNSWIVHGGDAGIIVAWEITPDYEYNQIWSTNADQNNNHLYSIENGGAYSVATGNIDDDDNLEILVGSGSGKVYAFDGVTHEVDWVSPVLEKDVLAIAIDNLDDDEDNEIVITTGIIDEAKYCDGGNCDGGEGYLYIFEKDDDSDSIIETFSTENIDAALGVTIAELDGNTYPEIAVATGYLEVLDPTQGTYSLHGHIRIYGYDGDSEADPKYDNEWNSDNLNDIIGGIDSGDLGGSNDYLVIGTGGNSGGDNEITGKIMVYKRSGGQYIVDTTIDSGRYEAYGIAIGDINKDGINEFVVGTGRYEDYKPTVTIYEKAGSSSYSVYSSETVDTSSVWGVEISDFDNDTFAELIFGTSGGGLEILDAETGDFEAKTSALSGKTGHYGGFSIANIDGEGVKEMVVGSNVYMWIFTTAGQTNKPDLAIEGIDITYTPQNPNEDEDIVITVVVHNYGGATAENWRVKLYDGNPSAGGRQITEYTCTCDSSDPNSEIIQSGENFTFQRTWFGTSTSPGYHEIYAVAEDISNNRETRTANNKDFTTIQIEEIPNDRPIVNASIDKSIIWIDEPARINAGYSYDNETTDGEHDRADDSADLSYKYNCDECPSGWSGYTIDVSFSTPGLKEIKIIARDERGKESEEFTLTVEVKSNTLPTAILGTNISGPIVINEGEFITFDVSQSFDPDEKSDLEYRFNFGDLVYSDWVSEAETVRLYKNALFTGSNGGELQQDSGEEVLRNEFGIVRVFRLVDSKLVEIVDNKNTGKGYNYTLPENTEQKIYFAKLMVRETSSTGSSSDLLASYWSENIEITVNRPENIPPVANAQAGIFVLGKGYFSDRVDYAKTGDEVTYSAAASYDPDGEDSNLQYAWRLIDPKGDDIDLLGDKKMKSFKRTYNEPGTYTAVLTVTDERGGEANWDIVVIVTASGGYGEEVEESGTDTNLLIGGAAAGVLALFGGARVLSRLRGGGDEVEDMFEEGVVPGPLELQCPSCGGLISITTTQRPIQIGCPMCQSQFVINE